MADTFKLKKENNEKNIGDYADIIMKKIGREVVHREEKELGDSRVIMICTERYYFRSKGIVSLAILLTENQGVQEVVITGYGGGGGYMNISWGANKDYANEIATLFEEDGFELTDTLNEYTNSPD